MVKSSSKFKDVIDDQDNNKRTLHCQFCGSIVLLPEKGKHVSMEKKLPCMTHKKDNIAEEGEDFDEFWFVDDIFVFENIGVTHTVGDIKYLTCADCEMGPIGFHIIHSKESYVALGRIIHSEA